MRCDKAAQLVLVLLALLTACEQNAPTRQDAGPGGRDVAHPPGSEAEYVDRMTRATALLDAHKPQQALLLYQRVLDDRPSDVEAQFGRGLALLALGEPVEAARGLEKAVAREPGFADAWFGLGEARRAQNDQPGARAAYERYLALDPQGRYAETARKWAGGQ